VSAITTLWQQLVRRKLWPVALLLLGALVAIPLVLAKEPAPLDGPPAPAAGIPSTAPGDPVVALASAEERDERRRVVGAPKDPFAPAPRPRPRRADRVGTTRGASVVPVPAEAPSSPSLGGGSIGTGGGGSAPAPSPSFTPDPLPTPAPAPGGEVAPGEPPADPVELYGLTVRFGDATAEELERRELPRMDALPSVEEAVLVYEGLSEDGKRAVFLLDANVVAQGDGRCLPSRDACANLELAEGETEFLDVTDEDGTVTQQFQLDVVKIHRPRTSGAKRATAARRGGPAAPSRTRRGAPRVRAAAPR